MPLARSITRVAALTLFATALVYPSHGRSAAPGGQPTSAKPPPPTEVEVRCIDDSVIKLKILDPQLELTTRYGTVHVPLADIRRIEFASRTPPDVAEKVANLIASLNHPDFDTRERVTAELRALQERAYLPLLKAIKHEDVEISRRADDIVRYLQQKLPPGHLEMRENDVIHTDDCKLTGKLSATTVRALTAQFGEQALRLADLRSLKSAAGIAADDLANAPTAPANLMAYQNQFGRDLVFAVTGPQPNSGGQGNGVWGTDVYSLDSSVANAAVHAGIVQPGQAAAVRIRVVASPQQFAGSVRNGVVSTGYGNYPAGAFEFVRK